MSTDLCFRSATTLASQIRTGDLSPVTLVDAFLDRIDQYNDRLTAYVTVCDASARAAAADAARAVEAGDDLGPLHGIPVAIKDLTRVKGVRTTYGSPAFADSVPDEDDIVVERLRDAGAIVLGKTNTPEFGRKTMTDNAVFGASKNPWHLDRTTGGSSGGSAAAVAAGLAPIAIGSDAAGSIRIPSSACGVFGLLPDFGRVPFGPSQADAFANELPYSYLGPITRTVADAALVLDVISGPDAGDPYSLPARGESYREAVTATASPAANASLRIGYAPDFGGFKVATDVRAVVEDALSELEASGMQVERADFSFDLSWEERHDALDYILQSRYVGLYENLKRDSGVDLLDTDLPITPEVQSRIRLGRDLDTTKLAEARRRRTAIYQRIQDTVSAYDIVVTPTLACSPPEWDDNAPTIAGDPVHPMHGWTLTWPLNLSGNPSASVPVGFTDDGLPVGLQLIGSRLDDRGVLAASACVESALPWREQYPPTGLEGASP